MFFDLTGIPFIGSKQCFKVVTLSLLTSILSSANSVKAENKEAIVKDIKRTLSDDSQKESAIELVLSKLNNSDSPTLSQQEVFDIMEVGSRVHSWESLCTLIGGKAVPELDSSTLRALIWLYWKEKREPGELYLGAMNVLKRREKGALEPSDAVELIKWAIENNKFPNTRAGADALYLIQQLFPDITTMAEYLQALLREKHKVPYLLGGITNKTSYQNNYLPLPGEPISEVGEVEFGFTNKELQGKVHKVFSEGAPFVALETLLNQASQVQAHDFLKIVKLGLSHGILWEVMATFLDSTGVLKFGGGDVTSLARLTTQLNNNRIMHDIWRVINWNPPLKKAEPLDDKNIAFLLESAITSKVFFGFPYEVNRIKIFLDGLNIPLNLETTKYVGRRMVLVARWINGSFSDKNDPHLEPIKFFLAHSKTASLKIDDLLEKEDFGQKTEGEAEDRSGSSTPPGGAFIS